MTLYVVATPIGNLSDCSQRAIETFNKATLIVAEDTRTSGQLLKLLKISEKKEFVSFHAQSSNSALKKAIERCDGHDNIVLVTDAGTPAISDPGSLFITEFRKSFPEALVIPIPGASAVITALSVSGFSGNHFEFLGFIPHKKGRETLFKDISLKEHTIVMYESPHRIMKTLESLSRYISDRTIMIGREMTKQFEEYKVGKPDQILKYYTENEDKVRGEFVIVISPTYQK